MTGRGTTSSGADWLSRSLPLTNRLLRARPHREGTVATAESVDPQTAHLAAALRTALDGFAAPQYRALRHMWRAGEILLTVRSRFPHGEWQPWLESTGIEPETAQRLMTLRQRCRTLHDVVHYTRHRATRGRPRAKRAARTFRPRGPEAADRTTASPAPGQAPESTSRYDQTAGPRRRDPRPSARRPDARTAVEQPPPAPVAGENHIVWGAG